MSDLGERLFRIMSGGRASAGQAASLPRMVRLIVEATGGNYTRAGKVLGVDRRTVSRWDKGQSRPSAVNAPIVVNFVRRAWLTTARENRLRSASIALDLEYRNDGRGRHVNADTLRMDPSVTDKLCDAFLAGAGPERLRRLFLSSIGETFYREWIDADDVIPDAGAPDDYGFNVLAVLW